MAAEEEVVNLPAPIVCEGLLAKYETTFFPADSHMRTLSDEKIVA